MAFARAVRCSCPSTLRRIAWIKARLDRLRMQAAVWKRQRQRLQWIGASRRRNSIYCNNRPQLEIVWISEMSSTAATGPNSLRITHWHPARAMSTFPWLPLLSPWNHKTTQTQTRTRVSTTATKTVYLLHPTSKDLEFISQLQTNSNVRKTKQWAIQKSAARGSQKWLSTNLENSSNEIDRQSASKHKKLCLKDTT